LHRDEGKLSETIDRLVDEIDVVLGENAGEFVKAYVQRGGERASRRGGDDAAPTCPVRPRYGAE
jgi:ubiquitin-like protein Pup